MLLASCWLLAGWEECRLASIIRDRLPNTLKTWWQGTMANVKGVTHTVVCYWAAKIISCFLVCMFQQRKHAVSWRHAFLLAFSPCCETDPAKWSMQVFSYLLMQSNISGDKCGSTCTDGFAVILTVIIENCQVITLCCFTEVHVFSPCKRSDVTK